MSPAASASVKHQPDVVKPEAIAGAAGERNAPDPPEEPLVLWAAPEQYLNSIFQGFPHLKRPALCEPDACEGICGLLAGAATTADPVSSSGFAFPSHIAISARSNGCASYHRQCAGARPPSRCRGLLGPPHPGSRPHPGRRLTCCQSAVGTRLRRCGPRVWRRRRDGRLCLYRLHSIRRGAGLLALPDAQVRARLKIPVYQYTAR